MSLYDPIRDYCERTGPQLLAEPLNAISNVAFFIAAWLLYKSYRASAHKTLEAGLLVFLVALVGLGSTLFHTFANGLTMIGDVVPIAMFTFYYLWLALRLLVGRPRRRAVISLILFAIVASQMKYIPDPWRFNGSVAYFPCLAALFIIGLVLWRQGKPTYPFLLKGALLFAISLTFRSLDMTLCPHFPIGTHFLWHTLNGAVLYLLTMAIIRVEWR